MSRFMKIKFLTSFVLAVFASVAVVGAGNAAVLFSKNYSTLEETRRGPSEGNVRDGLAIGSKKIEGSTMYGSDFVINEQLDKAVIDAITESGAVVFRVERTENDVAAGRHDMDTVFSLLDAKGRNVLTAYMLWNAPGNYAGDSRSGIRLYSDVAPGELWGMWYPLPEEIEVGQSFTLSVAWYGEQNEVYLNGVKLTEVYGNYLGTGGAVSLSGDFSPYVQTVTSIQIGTDSFEGDNSPSDGLALAWFEVHDIAFVGDAAAPEAVANIIGDAIWGGENEISWTASASADLAEYAIYRGEGAAPSIEGVPYQSTSALAFIDTAIISGITYYYTVVAVDATGNRSDASDVVSITAIAGDGPTITGVTTDSTGKPVRPGALVTISLTGLSGGSAKADIVGVAEGVVLAEAGSTGSYVGSYTVTDDDVAATTASYRVVGSLVDDYGASQLAGPEVMIIGLDILSDVTPPIIAGLEHDGWQVAGFSDKLVPGDIITATLEGEPDGFASFSLVGVTDSVQMAEVATGQYVGSYTVDWDDEGAEVAIEATLSDLAGNETKVVAGRTVEIDSRVRLLITMNDELLPADSDSDTRIIVRAENANGDDVSGHELTLTLSTTEEYTGVVGGGKVGGKFASKDDEDDLEIKWGGVTDLFGEVAATYTAGFAAKTALIVAKDMVTNDIGVGWLNTYVSSTVAIELTPVSARAAVEQAQMHLSVSPGWLTADGRSKARVKVWLSDLNGTPLSGARVKFSLGSDNGSIRVVRGVTSSSGLAEADYRAGTVAGFVSIGVEAPGYAVARNLQLELRSDAPAKIGLVATRIVLPADGRSTSDLKAVVTDINDNPNKQAPVLFSVIEGSGAVDPDEELTDDDGIVRAVYTAGRRSGTAVIEARHTSAAPSEDELRRVYGTVFVPKLMEKQERARVKIVKWLVDAGDEVEKGQPLVVLKEGKQSWTLAAPEKGVFVREVRFKRDRVMLGETIGYVEIDPDVWSERYAD